ncbi:MAG: glycosyltransferase family 39 protein [Actinobacteria bacterium]|nr:glycosyltransferase family 39 protein [Actinomycetota bacterium]
MVTEALQRRGVPRVGTLATGLAGGATILVALVAISAFSRTRAIEAPFWIDEGLSVGIASFPFSEIPGVLRQDGSPPLYYLLLHVWMEAFGTSEAATHALSLAFALLAVPAALWAGWSLFGRRTGWIAAAFGALNPFLTIYAQETRMYSLVILLSILATAAFAHAFVFRRRRYVPVFALVFTLMLYTHNWALFFGAGALAALAVVARQSAAPRLVWKDGALAFGGAAIAFAPWLPTLAYQALHTGAPWSNPPSPLELLGGPAYILSGQGSLVALFLAAGVGFVRIYERGPSLERTALLAILTLALATLLSGWLFSQLTPAWANRYLGVLLGPLLLIAAACLPRAGRLGLVALALVCLFWVAFRADDGKSNAARVATLFGDNARSGDVILVTQPEQTPVLAYYFGYGKRFATPLGPVADNRVMDWRDSLEELGAATPARTLEPLLEELPRGRRILLIRPLVRDESAWTAEWTSLVRERSEEWALALGSDERFTRTQHYVPPYTERVHRALLVEVFEKTGTG